MKKFFIIRRGPMLGIIASWILMAVAFWMLVGIQRHQAKVSDDNQRAIAYVCSTNIILDSLVVSARKQIREGLDNGTYQKLVDSGVLKAKDIDTARKTLVIYDVAHAKLNHDSPCLVVTFAIKKKKKG